MPERFEDMVVKVTPQNTPTFADAVKRWNIAEAQHAADMAHEIACPRCDGTGVWAWDNCCGSYTGCTACGGQEHEKRREMGDLAKEVVAPFRGTGRVTLGELVAADRARHVVVEVNKMVGKATPHGAA